MVGGAIEIVWEVGNLLENQRCGGRVHGHWQ